MTASLGRRLLLKAYQIEVEGGLKVWSLEGAMLKTQKGDLMFHYIC